MNSTASKHLIIVCQTFYPDLQSTSQLYTDLLRKVAREGRHKVTVICGFPSHYREGNGACPRHEVLDGMEIYRCGPHVDAKKNLFARIISYMGFALAVLWRILRMPNKDLVVGLTSPPHLNFFLWVAALIGRFRWQYLILDLYPDGLVAAEVMKEGSIGDRLWRVLNRWSFRHAERIIVLGRDMVDLVRERYGLRPERIVCIPHWSVMDQESPLAFEQCDLAQSLGLLGKFVVQYSGNMGLWHDIEIFVRAAAVLQHVPEIQFLFIGSGMRRAGAEALSRQLDLRNITWKSFVPKEQLRDSLACCHMSLVSMREGLTGIAVPCKIYGILASGRAMLAMVPAQTEVARVVEEEQCGVVVEPGNLEQLVATIQRLYADRVLTAGMGRNAFRAYKTKYTLEQATSTFEQVWSLEEPSASATPPPMRLAV